MKYKNIIIKFSNNQELESLQKHLFEYKYVWFDNGIRNRHIKKFTWNSKTGEVNFSSIFIGNDDIIYKNPNTSNYKSINYKVLERKIKLQRINEISI